MKATKTKNKKKKISRTRNARKDARKAKTPKRGKRCKNKLAAGFRRVGKVLFKEVTMVPRMLAEEAMYNDDNFYDARPRRWEASIEVADKRIKFWRFHQRLA